jgi:hypothetical protein
VAGLSHALAPSGCRSPAWNARVERVLDCYWPGLRMFGETDADVCGRSLADDYVSGTPLIARCTKAAICRYFMPEEGLEPPDTRIMIGDRGEDLCYPSGSEVPPGPPSHARSPEFGARSGARTLRTKRKARRRPKPDASRRDPE